MRDILYHQDRIVCDAGAWMVRAGVAGTPEPSATFPDVVGHLRAVFGPGRGDLFVGDDAYRMSAILRLDQPMQKSYVTDFQEAENVWNHLFYRKLRIDPSEHILLVTEPPRCPRNCREKLVQALFETYMTPAVFVANKSVLPLYANGLLTGVVLDCGEAHSWAVPIYEGFALPYSIQKSDIAGAALTDELIRLLMMRGLPFSSKGDRKIVRKIKEDLCFVSKDFQQEIFYQDSRFEERMDYMLPDGQIVYVGSERFTCPEALFTPSLQGMNCLGVHDLISKAIQGSDVDIRRDLASNVVVSGGSTMFPGFVDRLEIELRASMNAIDGLNVVNRPHRDILTWLGGSALAALSSFPDMCISAEEYDECGPSIVHRRAF